MDIIDCEQFDYSIEMIMLEEIAPLESGSAFSSSFSVPFSLLSFICSLFLFLSISASPFKSLFLYQAHTHRLPLHLHVSFCYILVFVQFEATRPNSELHVNHQ